RFGGHHRRAGNGRVGSQSLGHGGRLELGDTAFGRRETPIEQGGGYFPQLPRSYASVVASGKAGGVSVGASDCHGVGTREQGYLAKDDALEFKDIEDGAGGGGVNGGVQVFSSPSMEDQILSIHGMDDPLVNMSEEAALLSQVEESCLGARSKNSKSNSNLASPAKEIYKSHVGVTGANGSSNALGVSQTQGCQEEPDSAGCEVPLEHSFFWFCRGQSGKRWS
ncbi:hypothetical protein U1Q18_020285, partial [Sarracenia purpurea var. burkii]